MRDTTQHPYQDPTLAPAQRAEDLLARLPLEDKAGLMFQPLTVIGDFDAPGPIGYPSTRTLLERRINHFNTLQALSVREMAEWANAVQREIRERQPFAVPATISSDPRHAFGNNPGTGMAAGPFSQWPEQLGFGALDDPELTERFADTVRREYRAVGIALGLHPQIDLATDPRWSRAGGTYGQSVEVTKRLALAYVRGLQGVQLGPQSVAAMGKHFPGGGPQKDGEDPHFDYGREQVYPGGTWGMHLEPFEEVLDAGISQIMPYYGVPVGTEYDEVGFSFNAQIVNGLLRDKLGFDGIVCSDWGILSATPWGVEHLSFEQRMVKALEAGIDQFGGEARPDILLRLVAKGQVSEERINTSARRLLREKFTLGLFDEPLVDVERAELTVGTPEAKAAGMAAQAAAHALLTNHEGPAHLPLKKNINVYVEGMDPVALAGRANVVATPAEADVAVLRLAAPFEQRGVPGDLESFFHAGSLDFPADDIAHVAAISAQVPTVIDVYLDRAAVLSPLVPLASALVADFGASDEAFARVLFGEAAPQGKLPFELPSSMAEVEASRPDVPSDTPHPAFPFGHGLRYPDDWTPRPQPTETERAATTLARPRGGRYRLHRTSVGLLLKDPEAKVLLTEGLPQLFDHPMLNVSLGMDIETVTTMVAADLPAETRAAFLARLAAL
ncbi:glycoside hydrolase family 3 protein [Streptomyces violens]|uniref:glycoside hydrolase family 3 protein n=1 Tax=Streptomyces violens TaxID=66377 RepID=UPI0007C78814|nr:glycoside hydrolase family 3 N-terminal domain-containing protein [Streptomyces violens]